MIPVNSSTLGRYAAHVSLVHTIKGHKAPALSVMMIFSDLLIRSTEDSYREQGWEITPRKSGLVLRTYVAIHQDGGELEITPKTISPVITDSFRYNAFTVQQPCQHG